jgi:rod shape-determining protein MreD
MTSDPGSFRSSSGRSWRDGGMYVTVAALALIVLAQATLFPRIRLLGAQPDLLLVLVVFWSLSYGITEGLILAFLGGLAIDIVAGLPLGTSPLALMPICFLAVIWRSSVYVNNIWWPVLLVAIATPLEGWLMLVMRQLRGLAVQWGGTTTQVILPALALNVLLMIVVVRLLWRIGGRSRAEAAA